MAAEEIAPADSDIVTWFERVLVPESTPQLRSYVRQLLPGDPHRVDDIVQETLLRAWRHLTTVAETRSPQAWLSRVARNVVIDWTRRHAARPSEVEEELATAAWEPADQVFGAALDRVTLVGAMRTLSPLHQEILILVHYQDRTHAEVASALGVPVGTVKSRDHYATRQMQRALYERGITGRRY